MVEYIKIYTLLNFAEYIFTMLTVSAVLCWVHLQTNGNTNIVSIQHFTDIQMQHICIFFQAFLILKIQNKQTKTREKEWVIRDE